MNIKKIGLTALAGSLVATSAFAGSLSATGSAGINFAGADKGTSANGWTMTDTVVFSGGGEMDNGMNVTVSFELDNNAVGGSGEYMDSRSVVIDTNGMGTITFGGHGGSSAMGAVDDVMPTAYEEPWFGVTTPTKVDGKAANNMLEYKSPSMGGATFTATYNQSDAALANSQTSFAIAYSPEMVDGLTVGYATQEDDSTAGAANQVDDSTMYAKYVYGSVTVGVQDSEGDSNTDSADIESLGIGVSYAVSDELSISYGEHTVEFPNDSTLTDQESSVVSASYVSGGMTLSASFGSVDNLNGSTTAANDLDTYEIGVSFAF